MPLDVDNAEICAVIDFVHAHILPTVPEQLPITLVFLGCGDAEIEMLVCREAVKQRTFLDEVYLMDAVITPELAATADDMRTEFQVPVTIASSYTDLMRKLNTRVHHFLVPIGINNAVRLSSEGLMWDVMGFFTSCERVLRQLGSIASHYHNFLVHYKQTGGPSPRFHEWDAGVYVARYNWHEYASTIMSNNLRLLAKPIY